MHAFNASTREAESQGGRKFEVNLVYRATSRTTRATAHEEWKQHNKRAQQLIQVLATAFFRDRLWL